MKTVMDVEYSRELAGARRLDLFLPEEGGNGCGILFIHGGGWRGGGRGQWHGVAERFCRAGYVCASATYRLAPAARFPAQVEDVRAAMAFFRGRAGEYGFSPDRLAAFGSSAGGHLAAMLATIAPEDPLGAGGAPVGDTRPNAAVCYCPVTTLHEGSRGEDPLSDCVLDLLGKGEAEDAELYRAASPIDRVTGGEPPFLFIHGDADVVVPLSHSTEMCRRLKAAGAEAEVVVLPGVGHGFGYGVTTDAQRLACRHVEQFLARTFGL